MPHVICAFDARPAPTHSGRRLGVGLRGGTRAPNAPADAGRGANAQGAPNRPPISPEARGVHRALYGTGVRAAACESWREIDWALVRCWADGACSANDVTKTTECTTALTMPTGTEADPKAAMCTYAKDALKCYPKCYCDDAANDVDTGIKELETSYGCSGLKCGSAAGLRASAFSVFVAAAVALVAAH